MQTAKTGMEVAHTFKTIEVLGGNTAQEMARSAELDRLGKSGNHSDQMKLQSR